jgi:large subunit ribosomal protein L29
MSKIAPYREMTDDELRAALADASQEVFKLKMQQTLGQLENPARITLVRRNIARMTTITAQRKKQAAGDAR